MTSLSQDLRYAFRMLHKSPAFTLVATLTLALGIGANSALFSVVNSVLLRPLPFKDADRLVSVRSFEKSVSLPGPLSYPDFADLRQQNHSFEGLCVFDSLDFTLTGRGEPRHLNGIMASWDMLQTLGVKPVVGRAFTAEEDNPSGSGFAAIVSYELWQGHLGGSPSIIGQPLQLGGRTYTVVGVAPPGFNFPPGTVTPIDVWTTMAQAKTSTPPDHPYSENRGMQWLQALGRLKPGVSMQQASTELNLIQDRINKRFPEDRPKAIDIISEKEQVVGSVQEALLILLGAVAFVLLIACANVANLLLARATNRQKEISIRTALGVAAGPSFGNCWSRAFCFPSLEAFWDCCLPTGRAAFSRKWRRMRCRAQMSWDLIRGCSHSLLPCAFSAGCCLDWLRRCRFPASALPEL